MHAARTAALAVVTALTVTTAIAPADAKTTVIATLGTSPLLGYNAGTAQLADHVRAKSALFDSAGAAIGLTAAQQRELRYRIAAGHLTSVTVPRHLDAMTWASGNAVRVIRDVDIPAGTQGWETDIIDGGKQVALFIPAVCGNLSVIRRTAPRVAAARVHAPAPLAAAPVVAPATAAAPIAAALPPAARTEDVAAVPVPPPAPRAFHAGPLAALLPLLLGVHPGGGSPSSNAPAVVTTVYPPATGTPTVGVAVPGTPGVPTPNVGVVPIPTPPPVVTPPVAPPPPPPPTGVGPVPCGPNPCQ